MAEPGELVAHGEFVRIVAVVPGAIWDVWETVKEKAHRAGVPYHQSPQVENGFVLEALIADYLATPDAPPGFEP